MIEGRKDKNGLSILTFIKFNEMGIQKYLVVLEKGTCEKE